MVKLKLLFLSESIIFLFMAFSFMTYYSNFNDLFYFYILLLKDILHKSIEEKSYFLYFPSP